MSGSGCLDLLKTLKDYFPSYVESLTPLPGNLLSAEVKHKMQSKIRAEAGRRLNEHTIVLPELMVGDNVQLQNLRGKHPLKSDQNGVVTSKNGFNSYSVRISGSGFITIRFRATLRKILPVVQTDSLMFGQGQKAVQRPDRAQPDQGAEPELSQRPDRAQPGQRAGAEPGALHDRAS